MPELKSFLKDGEAEQYLGVTVRYVHGRTAVMTIYEGEKEIEQVQLHTIRSKEKLHAIMKEKGFVLKNNLSSTKEEEEEEKKDAAIGTITEADRALDAVTFLEATGRSQSLLLESSSSTSTNIPILKYPSAVVLLQIGTVVFLIYVTFRYCFASRRRRNRRHP
jgi:hypothetical protein